MIVPIRMEAHEELIGADSLNMISAIQGLEYLVLSLFLSTSTQL